MRQSLMVTVRPQSAGLIPSVSRLTGPKRVRLTWMFWRVFLFY